ncbi:conserved Plasmodium protein, unknown function [Plasmodium vivax]|uniref:Uncharacterized protein n=1 Tax=Plasmodium vivax TaxID=5855 RepID=A0A1G4HKC5_PLAVI|nr:conserved Plasmodium protein, unknown function [Plasmodium vivax]
MNFFSSKPNIRSTKSEVIHKANNNSAGGNSAGGNSAGGNNVGGNNVGGNSVGGNSVGGNSVGGNHVGGNQVGSHQLGSHQLGSHQVGSHQLSSHNVGPNGKMQNDAGSGNFLLEDSNGFAYSNCDADKRSEIHYSNKAYDPQYSMYMNKMANGVRSTRNHTSSHRICSPRSQSINLFAPKVNRTSNISRNFDDRLSYISFYTNSKNNLSKTSILESNDSFKTQANSQIVEQSLDLLKHLVNQENREQYLSAQEKDKKNKLILKLIDQAKRNDEKAEVSQTDCASNNSIDNYQKRMDMLHLKFMKLKNEYSQLNNENVILKKQIKNIKDNYHMINPKSATVSFPRGPMQEEALRSNDSGNSSNISNVSNVSNVSNIRNVNNEQKMRQQQGGRLMLNKTTSISSIQLPVIPPVSKKKLVDCQVQTECTLASPLPDRPDDTKVGGSHSSFNVNGNNSNSNLLNDNHLSKLREQIRKEVTQEVTNKLEQKYKDELLTLRQTIANNKMNNQNIAEGISIDNLLSNTKHKLDEQISETINMYKNNLFDHFKELINAASEGGKNTVQMDCKGDGSPNEKVNIGVDNFASLSVNDKINECISLFESITKEKMSSRKIKEKGLANSTNIISALNNINTDINDIDNMIDNLHANIGRTHFSDDAESCPGELDLLGKATSVSDDLEVEEEASRRSLSAAHEIGGEGELKGEVTTGRDKARRAPKRRDKIGDNIDGPASVRSDGPASVRSDGPVSVRSDGPASVRSDGPVSVRSDGPASVHSNGGTSTRKGRNSAEGDPSHRSNFHLDSPPSDGKIDVMGSMTMEINPFLEETAEGGEERSSEVKMKNANIIMHHSEGDPSSGNHIGVHYVHSDVPVDHHAGGEANGHNVMHTVEGMAEQRFNNEEMLDGEQTSHNLAPNDNNTYDHPEGDFPKGKDDEGIPAQSPDDKNKDSVDTEKEKKKSKWRNIFSSKKTKKKNLSDNFGNDTELWSKNENDEKDVKENPNEENLYNSVSGPNANNTLSNNVQIEEGEIDVITNGANGCKQIEGYDDAHKFVSSGYPADQPFMHPSGGGNGEKAPKSALNVNKGDEEFHQDVANGMMNNTLAVNGANHHYGGGTPPHSSNDNHFDGQEKFNQHEANPFDGSTSRAQMNPFNHENGENLETINAYNASNRNNPYMHQSNNETRNGPNFHAKGDYAVNCSVYSYNPAANNKTGFPSPSEERYEEKPFYGDENNSINIMNSKEEVYRNDNFLFIENNNNNNAFAKPAGAYQNSQTANFANFYHNDVDGNKVNSGLNHADRVNNQYDFFYNLSEANGAGQQYNPWGHPNSQTACINSYNVEGQFGETTERSPPNYYSKTVNIKRVNSSAINMTKNSTCDLSQSDQVKLSTKSEVHYNSFKAQKNKTKKNLEDLFA